MRPLILASLLLAGCASTPEPEPYQLTAEKLQVTVYALRVELRKLEAQLCQCQVELDTINTNIDLFLQE